MINQHNFYANLYNEIYSAAYFIMKETLHIYTRVSTTVQEDDGTSLSTQKELGLDSVDEDDPNQYVSRI